MALVNLIVKRFYELFDKLLDLLAWAGMGLVLFMALSIGLEVFLRRVVGNPTDWNVQVNELALLYLTFFAAVWVLRDDRHVRMTAILELASPKIVEVLYLTGSLGGMIVSAIITWKTSASTWESLVQARVISHEIDVPQVLTLWPIPFGFLLLIFQFARMAGNSFLNLRSGNYRSGRSSQA